MPYHGTAGGNCGAAPTRRIVAIADGFAAVLVGLGTCRRLGTGNVGRRRMAFIIDAFFFRTIGVIIQAVTADDLDACANAQQANIVGTVATWLDILLEEALT